MTRQEEAREYERKAKELRRAESDFWKEVETRRDEVVEKLGLSDEWSKICRTYGAESEEDRESLLAHLMSDRQVEYYRRNHKPADDAPEIFT